MRENDYKSPCRIGTALGLSYLCIFYDVWLQSPLRTVPHNNLSLLFILSLSFSLSLLSLSLSLSVPLSAFAFLLLWNNERWLDYSISHIWFIEKISMARAPKVAGQQHIVFVVWPLSDYHSGCWNVTMSRRLNCCLSFQMWGCPQSYPVGFSEVVWLESEHFSLPCRSSVWICSILTCTEKEGWPFSNQKLTVYSKQPVASYIFKYHQVDQMPLMTHWLNDKYIFLWISFQFSQYFQWKVLGSLVVRKVNLRMNYAYTLYCQKYSLTHPNNWNQVFQSLPWPQVYKSKHLGMQTVATNICERMGRSWELSEFQHGTVTGCHLCNKSSHKISSLLNIPRSTVSGIITKWKCLGKTVTQPRSVRPCWGAECAEVTNFLQSQSLQTSKLHVAFRLAQEQCVESFIEWVSMAQQPHPSHTSASAMQTIRCSGVTHAATGL